METLDFCTEIEFENTPIAPTPAVTIEPPAASKPDRIKSEKREPYPDDEFTIRVAPRNPVLRQARESFGATITRQQLSMLLPTVRVLQLVLDRDLVPVDNLQMEIAPPTVQEVVDAIVKEFAADPPRLAAELLPLLLDGGGPGRSPRLAGLIEGGDSFTRLVWKHLPTNPICLGVYLGAAMPAHPTDSVFNPRARIEKIAAEIFVASLGLMPPRHNDADVVNVLSQALKSGITPIVTSATAALLQMDINEGVINAIWQGAHEGNVALDNWLSQQFCAMLLHTYPLTKKVAKS